MQNTSKMSTTCWEFYKLFFFAASDSKLSMYTWMMMKIPWMRLFAHWKLRNKISSEKICIQCTFWVQRTAPAFILCRCAYVRQHQPALKVLIVNAFKRLTIYYCTITHTLHLKHERHCNFDVKGENFIRKLIFHLACKHFMKAKKTFKFFNMKKFKFFSLIFYKSTIYHPLTVLHAQMHIYRSFTLSIEWNMEPSWEFTSWHPQQQHFDGDFIKFYTLMQVMMMKKVEMKWKNSSFVSVSIQIKNPF